MWISYEIISDKNIRRILNIFTKENKRCYVSFPMLYISFPILYFPEVIKERKENDLLLLDDL